MKNLFRFLKNLFFEQLDTWQSARGRQLPAKYVHRDDGKSYEEPNNKPPEVLKGGGS